MQVKLIRCTAAPEELCGEAAALCTGYEGNPVNALKGALRRGHESVAEHAAFTFRIEGVSRALLAQLTRHRIASFSVQSQRYVDMDDMSVVVPPSIEFDKVLYDEYRELMERVNSFYRWAVLRGVPKEDARYVTPQAACTKLIMTMNARELMHLFELRTCNRAQWEIRRMADLMLEECTVAAPEMFKNAGCACMQGKPCPEGKNTCGKPRKRVQA